MSDWNKKVLKLKPDHRWRSKPGYKIFVADQGAVRFDFPEDWIVIPGSVSIKFHDREPPEDRCRLEVSFLRLPPVDWSHLPVVKLLESIVDRDERRPLTRGEIVQGRRPGLNLAWIEMRFTDPTERREASSRICLACGGNIQSVITLDFWPEDAERLEPIWNDVMDSLELGSHINDPTTGEKSPYE